MSKAIKHIIPVSFLVFFFSFSSKSAYAQGNSSFKKERKHFFYFTPNLSNTNKRAMPGLGFSVLKKNGWGISLEVKASNIQSEQMPIDFEPGLAIWGDGMPDDIYAFYILSVTKNFQNKNKQFVPGLTAGIAFTEKSISTNFIKSVPCTSFNCSWAIDFGGNYDYEVRKTKATGLFLKPDIKYVFSKHIATKVAPWIIVLPKDFFYGVEFSLLIGRIK